LWYNLQEMHRPFFVVLLVLLHHEASYSAAAAVASGGCHRRCGGATPVPYPFGFSAGCPIVLSCDVNTSTPILPSIGGDNGTSYRVLAFNSTASTFVLSLPSLCNRSVPDARRTLSGANYGVTSRTGLFLRGGCRETAYSTCAVPAAVMSSLLRTAQCGDNETTSAAGAVACVASNSPNATSAGGFLQWDKSDNTTCDDLLSSALFAETVEGTSSLEYGVAELGWWVNGTCGAGASEPCAANATCTDVRTPSGTEGHRCACVAGMDGDGFSAGDGCHPILKAKGELC
jgi:interleukin-1 receptor-associated kinase 1